MANILVVDDDPTARDLVVTVLATWYLESGLIREAIGALLDRPAAAAAS